MIDERAFAAGYHDFWRELLPMLTPSLVSILNSGHAQHLVDSSGSLLNEVEPQEGTRDAAVVAEYAFHVVRLALVNNRQVHDAAEDPGIRAQAEALAIRIVSSYEGAQALPDNRLNAAETREGTELALRYPPFVRNIGRDAVVSFCVPIPGAGRLQSCEADLTVGSSLVEVKTVKRPLASKDIRQLIVYLALNHAANRYPWTHAGFFNPRRATFHRWSIGNLVEELSGGRASVDVFNDLVEYACASDIQIDSVF